MNLPAKKRPRDPNQLAKLITDIASGDVPDDHREDDRDPAAVERGRLGGLKGGAARKAALSPAERSKIAKAAAAKRWKKTD